jgi:ribosome-associated protein
MMTFKMMTDTEERQEKSKSQIKRELLALQKLGRELVDLPPKGLLKIPLSDPIRGAIVHAKQLKMGALARELKHIGKLMRDEDVDAIQTALDVLRHPHREAVKVVHVAEGWRDALLAGNDGLLDELCIRFPDIDRQHLWQLVRNAKKEQVLNKPPRAGRELFRYLKELAG